MPTPSAQEEALVTLALTKPAAERVAWLDRECGDDKALRARLEALLAAHDEPDEIPANTAPEAKATIKLDLPDEPADEAVGQTLGRYKLLEKVGEGGCGVVYVAEQTQPVRRRVALKVIKLGMDTKQVVARFEAERQALAMMDHPNIAKVLDAGTTETGRPYFVMELVRGIRITDYCDQANLTTKERLDLFIKVCQAIQHAHQKGIIHRDIKPSNILVTLHDGVPVPKVIDFGIAKATEGRLTDNTVYTQLHQFIGTPAYMSPEQAEMSGLDIDTRSDIYSLGVLLYELLTGKTPFDAKELMSLGIDAMRKTIREKEPMRPSTKLATLRGEELTTTAKRRSADMPKLIHLLRGDLDWIVMKCLEKDRARRYDTANGLAMDIKRHLTNEPVVARPPSTAYRFQKLVRRNKLAFAAAGAVTAALVVGLAVAVAGLALEREAKRQAKAAEQEAVAARNNAVSQRERAESAGREARLNLYAADMMTAQQHLDHGNLGAARKLLDGHGPQSGADHRGWEWRYLREESEGARPMRLQGHTATVRKIRFSPDGKILASLGGDFRLWDLDKQNQARQWNRPDAVRDFAFTRDGLLGVVTEAGELLLLDPATLRLQKSFSLPGAESVVFSPVANAAAVHLTDASPLWLDLDTGTSKPLFGGKLAELRDVSDDGTMVCGVMKDEVVVWRIPDNVEIAREQTPPRTGWPDYLKFLPGHRGLLVGDYNREPVVLAFQDSQWRWDFPFVPFKARERGVSQLVVSQTGGFIAASSYNHEVSLWNLTDFSLQVQFHGHLDEAWSVAVSQDGRRVASGGQDRLVLLWDSRWRPPDQRIEGKFRVSDPVFSRDGRWLVLRGQTNRVEVWDLRDNRLVTGFTNAGVPLCFTEGDAELLTLTGTHLLTWYRETWQPAKPIELGFVAATTGGFPRGSSPLASAGGNLLAVADTNDVIHLLNVKSRKEVGLIPARVQCLALSPNGRWLALADASDGGTGIVHLWEMLEGKPVKKMPFKAHIRHIMQLSFSPDSRRLASFSLESLAKIWSVEPLAELHELRGHKRGLSGGGFSQDGRTLASVDHVHALNLWQVETGRQLASFEPTSSAMENRDLAQAAFSPDGRYLVTWWNGGHCQFWPAPSFEEIESSATVTAPNR